MKISFLRADHFNEKLHLASVMLFKLTILAALVPFDPLPLIKLANL